MAGLGAIAAIGGGVLGAIAGSQGDKTRTSSESSSTVNLQDFATLNKGQSGLEGQAYGAQVSSLNQFQDLVNAGPGASAVTDSTNFQTSLAAQLQQLFSQGPFANSQQIGQAQDYTNSIFAPQQTQLNQQFSDMEVSSNRLAARLGRSGNDPILRNKLRQEQVRQQQTLNSQKTAFGAEFAQRMPGMQAEWMTNVGGQIANIKSGLATQAFQNRQALMTLGNQLTASERNYRLGAANRTTTQSGMQTGGGGLGGAISGGLATAGTMVGLAGNFGKGGGGGTMLPASNSSFGATA